MGDEVGRDVLGVLGEEDRRGPPALRGRGDRRRVRGGGLDLVLYRAQRRERRDRLVAVRPAARGRERDDGPRASARRELQRDESAERVADDVRGLEAGRVHRALDRVGQDVGADLALEPRTAGVADERRGEHVVMAFERRKHELPGAPRAGEAVQQDERRPGAAAVRRGELRGHAPEASARPAHTRRGARRGTRARRRCRRGRARRGRRPPPRRGGRGGRGGRPSSRGGSGSGPARPSSSRRSTSASAVAGPVHHRRARSARFSATTGDGQASSSASYRTRICAQSVWSYVAASACSAAIAACSV